MYYEVKSLQMTEISDFPFMDIEYFEKLESAEKYFENKIKEDEVIYSTIEKIGKTYKKNVRSYKK